MDDINQLSIHSLNIILNARRAATPSLLDAEDPVRVAILKRIEQLRLQK